MLCNGLGEREIRLCNFREVGSPIGIGVGPGDHHTVLGLPFGGKDAFGKKHNNIFVMCKIKEKIEESRCMVIKKEVFVCGIRFIG